MINEVNLGKLEKLFENEPTEIKRRPHQHYAEIILSDGSHILIFDDGTKGGLVQKLDKYPKSDLLVKRSKPLNVTPEIFKTFVGYLTFSGLYDREISEIQFYYFIDNFVPSKVTLLKADEKFFRTFADLVDTFGYIRLHTPESRVSDPLKLGGYVIRTVNQDGTVRYTTCPENEKEKFLDENQYQEFYSPKNKIADPVSRQIDKAFRNGVHFSNLTSEVISHAKKLAQIDNSKNLPFN